MPGVLAVVLALALGGCGGGDEQPAQMAPTEAQRSETEPTPTETQTTETIPPPTAEEPGPETDTKPEESPEDGPGGAGDEEPARTLALFTGKGGRITPPVIRVPAFISIRVELRSADGGEYGLTFGDETISVAGGLASVSTALDGLRPGRAVIGRPAGRGTRVRIEATAEPGP